MAVRTSSGKCRLCGQVFKANSIGRHLQACLGKSALPAAGKSKPVSQKLYHIRVTGAGSSYYWMHLLMPTAMELASLDNFLRSIWLECCGHCSHFEIGDRFYTNTPEPDPWSDDKSAEVPLSKVLKVGDEFGYEYDFGSTTELSLKVVGELVAESPKNTIVILARNAAPQYVCVSCGKPASYICTTCAYDHENPFYCKKCNDNHKCDSGGIPISNSPRMGECAYCGESDKDEDAFRAR